MCSWSLTRKKFRKVSKSPDFSLHEFPDSLALVAGQVVEGDQVPVDPFQPETFSKEKGQELVFSRSRFLVLLVLLF